MNARERLDAATLAERMNARPLPEDCDGGTWRDFSIAGAFLCDECGRHASAGVCSGTHDVCLSCALADCERAEAEHRAADPHCTCNDCMAVLANPEGVDND